MTKATEVAKYLKGQDSYSVMAHGGPDGDSIGSILAMGLALRSLGKRVRIYCSDPIPNQFFFLKSVDEIIYGIPKDYNDTLIVLDCSDEKRLTAQDIDYEKFHSIVNIDHHPFNTNFGTINYCDESKIATAELVYEVILMLNIELTKDIADPLYLGVLTDSGGFGYENTSPKTHEIVARLLKAGVNPAVFKNNLEKITLNHLKFLGFAFSKIQQFKDSTISLLELSKTDLNLWGLDDFNKVDDLVDYLRNIEGTEVAILVKKEKDQNKFSLRSTSDYDVGELCRSFGGGGHKKAAGFSTTDDTKQIIKLLIEKIN